MSSDKEKRSMPQNIFLGNDKYEMTLLRIESRHEDGRPEVLRTIGMDQHCELSENPEENCFLIGYVNMGDFKRHAGKLPTI